MKKYSLLLAFVLPLLALALSSCGNKNNRGGQSWDMTSDTANIPTLEIQESSGPFATEGKIRGVKFLTLVEIKTVNFDYDRYELSDEVRATLQANAALINAGKDISVLVEGHCDDRGTVEYNLALGQKRAKSVRDYYVSMGVPGNAVGTITFGEERPLCTEATDACWLKNRRAETKTVSK